ncbi:MAG: DUF1015 domain-containing protein, partial [Balneolaceae bacterium]|nr:DUF1015 domain-containing protein [Balneolaceae bacterium]
MAVLHPFKAWRPVPAKVKEIACVPYDVVSTAEAREKVEGNPHSFLHVVRPEIDLPEGTPYNDDRVYEKGAANLRELLRSDLMEQEPEPAIYIYRLTTEDRSQTGVFSCVSVEDYDSGVILKHELTRPDKEDDRTRHILEQSAHAEPVMLAFDDQVDLSAMMENITANENPIYDFEAEDGIRHSLWKAPENIRFIDRFAALDRLYIADGHHRCKSASRAAEVLRTEDPGHTGKEEYNFFPAVIFPKDQMEILPYNRVIHEVPEDVIDQLNRDFDLEEPVDPKPERKGRIALYYGGRWFGLSLPLADDPNAVEQLDV